MSFGLTRVSATARFSTGVARSVPFSARSKMLDRLSGVPADAEVHDAACMIAAAPPSTAARLETAAIWGWVGGFGSCSNADEAAVTSVAATGSMLLKAYKYVRR